MTLSRRPSRSRTEPSDAIREALIVIWEASDRVCGKRLKPLVLILVKAMCARRARGRRLKAEKAHEREPIVDQKFGALVREVVAA